MQKSRDTLSSNELDGSRDRSDTRLGSNQVTGSLSVEMSYGAHDDFYAALLGGAWSAGSVEAGVTVTVDASAKTFTRSAGSFTASVGDLVRFNDLTGGNSLAVVVTAATATVITAGNVPTGILQNETDAVTSFTHADFVEISEAEATFTVLESNPDLNNGAGGYFITTGVKFTNLAFNLAVNALNTATLQTIGMSHAPNAALPAGSTFAPIVKATTYSGVDGTIYEAGAAIGFVNSAEATTDTEASAQFAIGSTDAAFIEQGRVLSDLTISTFFTDFTLLEKFASETETSIDLLMSSVDGALMFSYPRVVYTSGAPDVSGPGSITQSLSAQALQGASGESSIKIQRLSHA